MMVHRGWCQLYLLSRFYKGSRGNISGEGVSESGTFGDQTKDGKGVTVYLPQFVFLRDT